jgi:hypothetical protein
VAQVRSSERPCRECEDGVLNAEESPRQRRLVDKRELRGWPAAVKGIGGAIPGSQPGHGLFDDE